MKKLVRIVFVSITFLCLLGAGLIYCQSGIFDRTGVIPGHGSHGSLPEENIDLFTGNVTLRYRDVFLPGPEGLNVEVWRVYNSKILEDWQSGQPGVQAYHKSWVGIGWTMHMGMVHQETSSTPVIEFPDGRLETAFLDKYDANNRYLTRDFLRYDKVLHKLYFQNGVIWTFGAIAIITRADGSSDPVRLVTRIENSFGHYILVAYNIGTSTLKTITDAFGRIITFTSSGNPRKLSQITYRYTATQYRTVTYSVGTFANGYFRLNTFQPPGLPSTVFEYNDGSSNYFELKKITTSYGGVLEYSYDNHVFFFNSTQLNSRVLVQKKITFNPNEQPSIWNYSYPDYNGTTTGTVNVQGPVYNTSVTYNSYDPTCAWKIGTINALEYGDGSYSETCDWTFQEISNDIWTVLGTNMGTAKGPLLSSITRHKEGGAHYKEEYLYEISQYNRYGLPSKVLHYINRDTSPLNYKTIHYYFGSNLSYEERFLLALPGGECEYSGDATKQKEKVTTYYEESGKWGATLQDRIWKEGSTYVDWSYIYMPLDSQGKHIQLSIHGPVGSRTTKEYAFGVEEKSKRGDTTTIVRVISEYDSSISREILQDGATLIYTYDSLGRVILVNLPDDRNDATTVWRPDGENKSVTKQTDPTIGDHTITRFWDGMGRETGYTEEGDETTLYFRKSLDAEGRVIAKSDGSTVSTHESHYVYNAAGEIVQITDPLGRETHITLDGTTKTVLDPEQHSTAFEYEHLPGLPTSVTDAQGHNAAYEYDSLGRLMTVDYNNGARTHSFEYDRNDNLISERHPETGLISYSYNDENWLCRKDWSGAITTYVHNLYNGILYLVLWGDGVTTEEQQYYLYSTTGRLIRVTSSNNWKRDGIKYDLYGNVTEETIYLPGLAPKTIKYEYDRNNNLSKTIYPDYNWAQVTNNTLYMPERLAFNNTSNYLVSAASYGPGKAATSLAFARNGTQFSASYFSSGELHTASLTRAGITLYDASYDYDGNGNVSSISSTAPTPSMSATFGYDALNRLTSATYSSGRVNTFTYAYDEYGNMRTVQENGLGRVN